MTIRSLVFYALLAAAAAVITFVALTSGDPGPSPAACKAAMQQQFDHGIAHPDAPEAVRPAACKGVSDKDVQRFASEIMSDYLEGN